MICRLNLHGVHFHNGVTKFLMPYRSKGVLFLPTPVTIPQEGNQMDGNQSVRGLSMAYTSIRVYLNFLCCTDPRGCFPQESYQMDGNKSVRGMRSDITHSILCKTSTSHQAETEIASSNPYCCNIFY